MPTLALPQLSTEPAVPSPPTDGRSRAVRLTRSPDRARETFLTAYGKLGNVTAASKVAGIDRKTVYTWAEQDDQFAAAFRDAGIRATEVLEAEAWRRAKDGVAEPVFQGGKQVGVVQRYSDQLLMFMLRARAPEKYRDNVSISVTPVIKAVAGFDPADVL